MAKIDKVYHDLLNKIVFNGFSYEDPNRKGVTRIQIPLFSFEHDFKDGFPAITTKKLYWKGVVGELLWFLRGDTNIKYLVNNGINIWNKDAYNYYVKDCENIGMPNGEIDNYEDWLSLVKQAPYKKESNYGNLGRVYGAQWRRWCKITEPKFDHLVDTKPLDQISNLIKGLKENPMGTKHIVTAWNPAELDEMALPPCHWSFEILVEPYFPEECKHFTWGNCSNYIDEECLCKKDINIPKYQFTLKWHQRSVDTFLGLPFNIASYALLAQIIGKMANMIPKGIIGDLSNVHIYEPHLDAVKEQLSRDVDKYDKCDLHFVGEEANQYLEKRGVKSLDSLNIRNFKLRGYESYPAIKAEMIAYNK